MYKSNLSAECRYICTQPTLPVTLLLSESEKMNFRLSVFFADDFAVKVIITIFEDTRCHYRLLSL